MKILENIGIFSTLSNDLIFEFFGFTSIHWLHNDFFFTSHASVWKAGPLDIQTNGRRKERQDEHKKLRKALCIGYANQLAERMIHHNGYRTLGFKPQVVQVFTLCLFILSIDGLFRLST